jgi:hypothetical protein
VAHNSFIHSFTELGLLGGTLFTGAFYYALSSFYRLGRQPKPSGDGEVQRLRVYLTAVVVAYAACLLSLSRAYIAPTYLILGTSTAYLGLATAKRPGTLARFNGRLVWKFMVVGAITLAVFYLIVRIFAQYS